jgi:hypothetical protein
MASPPLKFAQLDVDLYEHLIWALRGQNLGGTVLRYVDCRLLKPVSHSRTVHLENDNEACETLRPGDACLATNFVKTAVSLLAILTPKSSLLAV